MHFHLPKPLHGWREFAGEVGIIVIGVLIALGAEQVVERARWASEVRDARATIHREMAFDLAFFADRIRVAPCIDRHLEEAATLIDTAAKTNVTPGEPINLTPPGRLTRAGEYQAQQAAQNLVHFPIDELSALGLWYDQVISWSEWDSKEETAWSGLQILTHGPTRLGPMDIALLRRDVEQARYLERLVVLNSRRELDRAKAMGVKPGPSRADYVQLICREG